MTQQPDSEEILEGRGLRIRRATDSTEEVKRAHVEASKGANAGSPHIHRHQEERFIVHTGALNVRQEGFDAAVRQIRASAGEMIESWRRQREQP